MSKERLYTGWGETKTLKQWFEDPRCKCPDAHTIRMRMSKSAWPFEKALTTPKKTKPKNKKSPPKKRGIQVTAWGVTMNLSEWARQTYVPVSWDCLYKRILTLGWDPERALTAGKHEPQFINEKSYSYMGDKRAPYEMTLGSLIKRATQTGFQRKNKKSSS